MSRLCSMTTTVLPRSTSFWRIEMSFATGERRGALAQFQVVEPDVGERLQSISNCGNVFEEFQRLLDSHRKYLMDVFVLEFNFERFFHESLAIAHVAGHVDGRQKMHLP